ncbi:MAG: metal ABC transporter solute-binding protein, Zn/Mn family [Chlamydiota bacterium]
MRKIIIFLCLVVGVADAKPTVVATTSIVADAVSNVAGDLVEVETLMGPGIDPHLYVPTYGDMRKLSQADIIFYNGLYLEGKMDEILKKMSRHRTVVAVAENIIPQKLIDLSQGDQNYYDPHVWFDPQLWKSAVESICKVLVEKYPLYAEVFIARSQQYQQQLEELDNWCRQQMDTVPVSRRYIITAHDAFNYLGIAYNAKVVGLQGITTTAEYGLYDLAQVINLVIDNNIKALFLEASVPKRSIESLQKALLEKGRNVKIGGKLYSDSLGLPQSPEGTYQGMVKYNINTITEALR